MINKTRNIVLVNLIPLYVVFGNSWIVSETNGDFVKIQDALNVAVAGDTIFVKGKSEPYYESLTFPRSGNANDGYIVLMNYENDKPIINGTGVDLQYDWPEGLVRVINKSYIKIIGFEIRNIIVNINNLLPAGIWIYGGLNNIEIRDNIIHTIQQTANNAGAHGIAVYGTNSNKSISNILIDKNEIFNCKLGWSESLVLNGNVENFVVSNNIVHDNNNIAFDFIGHEGECPNPDLDQARNGLVVSNIAYNIDSRGNQAYGNEASADGIYVDGGRNIIIDRNLVYNCNIGIEIASEHGGKLTSGIIVRNNLVTDNDAIGIAFGGYDNKRGATQNCTIINNTLYKNNSESFNWGAEILQQYYCTNNTVANNIIYSLNNISLIDNTSQTGSDNIYNYNLYYSESTPKWNWETKTYSELATLQSESKQEQNSYFAEPKVIILENYELSLGNNSPAIGNGFMFSDSLLGELDYSGNERIIANKIDIGAFEFSGISSIKNSGSNIENKFQLFHAYPNPFNPTTKISFETNYVSKHEPISLNIYNSLGEKIFTQSFKIESNKVYNFTWNAKKQCSGIYYAVLHSENYRQTEKLLLLK